MSDLDPPWQPNNTEGTSSTVCNLLHHHQRTHVRSKQIVQYIKALRKKLEKKKRKNGRHITPDCKSSQKLPTHKIRKANNNKSSSAKIPCIFNIHYVKY